MRTGGCESRGGWQGWIGILPFRLVGYPGNGIVWLEEMATSSGYLEECREHEDDEYENDEHENQEH